MSISHIAPSYYINKLVTLKTFLFKHYDVKLFDVDSILLSVPHTIICECVCVFFNILGKPRSLSSTHLGMIKFRNKREDLSFDVIGYPVPLNCEIWFDPSEINNSKPFTRKFEGSELNVTCKASSKYLYLSRCTLTILSVPFQSDGLYILQVINEHGKENFTVEISYGE